MSNKEVQSIVTTRFTGDHKAVASEAQKKNRKILMRLLQKYRQGGTV